MDVYVADTHALLWYLVRSPRLGPRAIRIFNEGESGRVRILVPTIVLAELYYANLKWGPFFEFADAIALVQSAGQFEILPLSIEDVLAFAREEGVKEMHDRIIAGVARRHEAPLLSRDRDITASGVRVVW